jgi:peptidoglycan/LPS O-acetylase OafA/YrhL
VKLGSEISIDGSDGARANTSEARLHFYWLDAMRGIAALSVLLWHYNHFYFATPDVGFVDPAGFTHHPFYSVFWLFYEHGLYAVQFFWLLSGFVFAHTYFNRPTGNREFLIARFARLYPLHFLTLIIVAIMQFVSFNTLGRATLFENTDLYHYVLQVFLISGWGFENGNSFNVPIWSVSAEIAVYLFFLFLLSKAFFRELWGQLAIVVLTYVLTVGLDALQITFWDHKIVLQCATYFFVGIVVYSLLERFDGKSPKPVILALGVLAFGIFGLYRQALSMDFLLTFGAILYLVGCVDKLGLPGGRLFSPIAAITYTVYLVHVPTQIAIVLWLDNWGIDRSIADSNYFFIFYNVLVISLSAILYRKFERPLDKAIRRYGNSYLENRNGSRSLPAPAE